VLDRQRRLVPEGVAGELHVASVGLPEGYHGLDSLNAERFLPNPFGDQPSDRLYNTGDVVRISSGLSRHANHGFVAQSTAKAALDAFVRALASELGPGGVRVNTVAPGVTLTDGAAQMSLVAKAASAANCPLGRNGLPEDMAGAVLFLASDLSRFMTGSYLPVDGGFTML
jgi:NAD(P)-dependent dehydrogenase (short-subunit alcohol dehydrogenase family)